MARKKKAAPKKSQQKKKNRPGKKPSVKVYLIKSLAGLTLLLALVVLAAFSAHHLLMKKGRPVPNRVSPPVSKSIDSSPAVSTPLEKPELTPKTSADSKPKPPLSSRSEDSTAALSKTPVEPKPKKTQPPFEIFPDEELPSPKPPDIPQTVPPSGKPRVAIIIDDIGWDWKIARKFIELDSNLTFSFIPHSPFQKKIGKMAMENGIEMMLHLPMEPKEYPKINPGKGALLTSMEPDALIAQLERNIDAVEGIKGVNSHMGSRMTSSSTQMYQIFSILKKKNLYFIDSYTTPDSVAKGSARLLQLPFAQRDVFIDHFLEPNFIRGQLKKLTLLAQKHGQAVGIAHPHDITVKILKETLPGLKTKTDIVPASRLVREPE